MELLLQRLESKMQNNSALGLHIQPVVYHKQNMQLNPQGDMDMSLVISEWLKKKKKQDEDEEERLK